MKTVILFDLDGTLIDSTEAILESFHKAFEVLEFNFQGSNEDIKKEIGYPLDIMFPNLGVNKDEVSKYVDAYKEHYRTISEAKTILLKDALEAVKLANEFATLGVVTTKTTKYSIPLLENFNIYQYFDVVIGRQEVENPKPHPEPIFKAMEGLNITANSHNIFMIGDTKLDLIAAKEAKIKGVGVTCGYGTKEELNKYTKLLYQSSLEAVKNIQNNIQNNI